MSRSGNNEQARAPPGTSAGLEAVNGRACGPWKCWADVYRETETTEEERQTFGKRLLNFQRALPCAAAFNGDGCRTRKTGNNGELRPNKCVDQSAAAIGHEQRARRRPEQLDRRQIPFRSLRALEHGPVRSSGPSTSGWPRRWAAMDQTERAKHHVVWRGTSKKPPRYRETLIAACLH